MGEVFIAYHSLQLRRRNLRQSADLRGTEIKDVIRKTEECVASVRKSQKKELVEIYNRITGPFLRFLITSVVLS